MKYASVFKKKSETCYSEICVFPMVREMRDTEKPPLAEANGSLLLQWVKMLAATGCYDPFSDLTPTANPKTALHKMRGIHKKQANVV
jgi:hypothetical protein